MRTLCQILLVAAAVTLLAASRISAQCCTAGSPVNSSCALGVGGRNALTVTASFLSSFSDTYYHGTERLDTRYTESGYSFSSLALAYGITDHLRVTTDLGYYFRKSQRFVASDYTRYTDGISDATIGISYDAWGSDDGLSSVTQSARVTIPVGAFEQEYDGVVLPIDFQSSSGNYRYSAGLLATRRFDGSPLLLLASASVELSQAIVTRSTWHRYGNLYQASLTGAYPLASFLQGFLQIRCEARDRALTAALDQRAGGQATSYSFVNASGGVLWYVAPQISATLHNWTVSMQFNYPVAKNVYGSEQLTTRSSFGATVSHALHFGGDESEAAITAHDTTLPHFAVAVRGNCEQCKTRIEKAARAVHGVSAAVWDEESKLLSVYHAGAAPDADAIEQAVAAVGHDTDHHRAPDDVYDALPACCLYREK